MSVAVQQSVAKVSDWLMFEETMPPETPTRRRNDNTALGGDLDHHGINNDNSNGINCNNNNNIYKFSHASLSATQQHSLVLPDGHLASANQSFLAPPSLYSRERRPSTSSCDSSTTGTPSARRRSRRNSSIRFSEFEEIENEVTLMTFAKGAQTACRKAGNGLRRAVNTLLFVSRPTKPNIVCEADILEQAGWICKDYIISKLMSRDLMSRKIGVTASDWTRSTDVISAGHALESMYPKTYSNVSRKLCMTMSSTKIVKTTLTLLLDVLFEGAITWGKVVSMFAVAGLYAEECTSQGHPDFVKEVVDIVVSFTESHLLPWLVAQGGWEAFPGPKENGTNRLSKTRLMMVAGGTAALVVTGSVVLDLW